MRTNCMTKLPTSMVGFCVAYSIALAVASEPSPLQTFLDYRILSPDQALAQAQAYTESRVPLMPVVNSVAAWEKLAEHTRRATLERVVFRGEADQWRDAKTKVVWLEMMSGGPGYRIKKLRYEALPGLWIPA